MPSVSYLMGRCITALPGGPRLLARVSGAAARGAAPIFMFHRVLPDPEECYDPEMAVSLAAFSSFLAWLESAYEVVALEALLPRLRQHAGPRPLCALTFDDGWIDTFTHAFPLLRRRGWPATVFLPLEFIGSRRVFWQQRLRESVRRLRAAGDGVEALRAAAAGFAWCPELAAAELDFDRLRRRLVRRSSPEAEAFVARLGELAGVASASAEPVFMNWDQVEAMRGAGMRFGSHTLSHNLLRWAAPSAARAELEGSRRRLTERLREAVTTLSYPWGAMSPFTREQAADAGYELAVTTVPGLARSGGDPLRLPRVAVSDAQLGWRRGRAFRPGTIQVHLGRARRAPVPAPPPRQAARRPRLRIGFLVDNPEAWGEPPQGHLGGSELQLLRLIEALDPEYFQPELYFLRPPESGLPARLPWPVYGTPPGTHGRLRTILALRRLLRRHRPQVVQSMFVDGTFLGVSAAWLAGVPAILCARRNAGYWKKWFHRAALRLVNRMATSWQANARVIAAMLEAEEGVPAGAIEIVPNWIDLDRFRPFTASERRAARDQLGLDGAGFVAVCVANYSPVKDLGTLVAAAAQVGAALPRARVLLVGEGPERAPLEAAIARLGLGETVRLTGESAEVEHYLAAADVGVLPSRSEGCSNAVLEYMAAGLPTVLSDIPANRALSGEGLYAAGDAAALAAELERVAGNPGEAERRGRDNRHRVEQYGGAAFAACIQGHYLRVYAARRRQRQG